MIIIRTGPPYYNLIIDALQRKIPSQSVFNAGKDLSSVQEKIKYVPIFGTYYLVITDYVNNRNQWKLLKDMDSKTFVKIVLLTRTSEDFMNACIKCDKSKIVFKVYDSYKASVRDRELYIMQVLRSFNPDVKMSKTALKTIRERLYGYTTEVNIYLQQLAYLPLTEKTIKKIIPKKNKLTLAGFSWMLYAGKVSLIQADDFIMRYKYYPQALAEVMLKYTDNLLDLYKYYINGEFTELTLDTFVTNNKKLIPSIYAGESHLKTFERLSYDRLCQISILLSEVDNLNKTKGVLNLYKSVRLICGVI